MVREWKKLLQSGIAKTWMAMRDKKPVGVLGALFMTDFYTGKLMAFEQFWFVLEAERRGAPGLRLFKAYEAEAAKRGCRTIWVGQNNINSPENLSEFYQRKGFLQWGSIFRKVTNG